MAASERVYKALDDFAKEQLGALWITPGHPDFKIMRQRKEQRKAISLNELTESVQKIRNRTVNWPDKLPLGPSEFAELELYLEKRTRNRSAKSLDA